MTFDTNISAQFLRRESLQKLNEEKLLSKEKDSDNERSNLDLIPVQDV